MKRWMLAVLAVLVLPSQTARADRYEAAMVLARYARHFIPIPKGLTEAAIAAVAYEWLHRHVWGADLPDKKKAQQGTNQPKRPGGNAVPPQGSSMNVHPKEWTWSDVQRRVCGDQNTLARLDAGTLASLGCARGTRRVPTVDADPFGSYENAYASWKRASEQCATRDDDFDQRICYNEVICAEVEISKLDECFKKVDMEVDFQKGTLQGLAR